MKNLLSSFKTLVLLILAILSFGLGFTAYSSSMLINLLLIIFAIFILFVACDDFDKANHLGKYADKS